MGTTHLNVQNKIVAGVESSIRFNTAICLCESILPLNLLILNFPVGMDPASAQQATETLGIVCEISNILGTGLDRETLSILIGLLGEETMRTGHESNLEQLAIHVQRMRSNSIACSF